MVHWRINMNKSNTVNWSICNTFIQNCIYKNKDLMKLKKLNTTCTVSKHLNKKQSDCFQRISQWKYGNSNRTIEGHSNEIINVLNGKCYGEEDKISKIVNTLHQTFIN